MRTRLALPLCMVACQQAETACEEVNRYLPSGAAFSNDEQRCAEILQFSRTVPSRYGMDFKRWLETVSRQRFTLSTGAILWLSQTTSHSFSRVPASVPCGGLVVDDLVWNRSVLPEILPERPPKLYASVALELSAPSPPAQEGKVRVYQDFDCDGDLGVMEIVGTFAAGSPWRALRSSFPPIDE